MRAIVLGGHVLATLGRPRFTDDLDVLVEPTKANASRLAKALDAFGYPELAAQTEAHFSELDRMATLGRPPVAIDILSSTPGLDFREAWRGRQEIAIAGRRVAFLGLAEFVKTKPGCSPPRHAGPCDARSARAAQTDLSPRAPA